MKIGFKKKTKSANSQKSMLHVAGETHVGLIREVNEDSFCYIAYPEELNSLAAVADGIGGHQSGDVASSICCEHFISAWKKNDAGNFSADFMAEHFMTKTIIEANTLIHDENCRRQLPQPMGTTIVAALFTPKSIVVAHSGDSRLYILRNGLLQRLTEDHSYVAELVRRKIITENEAAGHPFSHIISRSLGPSSEVEPEVNIFPRLPADRFILCSDGLTIHLQEKRIEEILMISKTPREALDMFMKETLISGGEDNVTVICIFSSLETRN
jgi:protein phosphatase